MPSPAPRHRGDDRPAAPSTAYTRGVVDGLAAAIALLGDLQGRLAGAAGAPGADPDAPRSVKIADGVIHLDEDAAPETAGATWVAALAVALAIEREPSDRDVEELVLLSGRDPLALQLAAARLHAADLDDAARARAATLLDRAADALRRTSDHAG